MYFKRKEKMLTLFLGLALFLTSATIALWMKKERVSIPVSLFTSIYAGATYNGESEDRDIISNLKV